MTNADRVRLASKIADLKAKLADVVEAVEDIRADVRTVEGNGADGLIFWPCTMPSADRPMTDVTAWSQRVDEILGSAAYIAGQARQ